MTNIKGNQDGAGTGTQISRSFTGNTTLEGTHDEIANYLTDGFQIWFGEGRQAFDIEVGGTLSANITALTDTGQQLARWALESWANISGIHFEFVEHDDAHIVFDDEQPGGSAITITSGGVITASLINVSKDYHFSDASSSVEAFFVYIHEIGHVLGLGHAGPYNGFGTYGTDNIFLNDSNQVSVMSYFDQEENTHIDASRAFPVTPMIVDIIALHDLYGAPTEINPGDTIYGYQSNVAGYLGEFFQRWTGEKAEPLAEPIALTLYDNGGNDTLDLRTDRNDQRIDLRPQGVSDVYGLKGNLSIARDTWIENVIAGAGDDVLIGNARANYLQGRAGADELRGDAGDDVLEGGAGADWLDGGAGLDVVSYRGSDVAVTANLVDGSIRGGHAEGDVIIGIEGIIGSDYDDLLQGNAESNRLEGGPGADRLDGGAGADWLSYRGSDAGVTVNLSDNRVAGAHAEGDEIVNFENVTGSAHADKLIGDAGANELDGGAGADLLQGRAGADRLTGGAGEDTASYEQSTAGVTVRLHTMTTYGGDAQGDSFGVPVNVRYTDRTGNAQVERVPDVEHLRGSAHADILAGDSRANRLEGGPGADLLYGGPGGGDDVLLGGAGADALYGGIGNDMLEGGAGADTLRGGLGADTASYRHSGAAVLVRLSAGVAQGGHAEGDVIVDIENITGSAYNDELIGDGRANVLEGGAGADRLDGGGGVDRVSYQSSDARVIVRLSQGAGSGGHAAGDILARVEDVTGSAYSDELVGDSGANYLDGGKGDDELHGNGGDDVLEGGAGADRLHGGAGADTLSYRRSDSGVHANLKLGTATGGHADDDTFNGIENIMGSVHRDILTGNDEANDLDGAAGDDELHGAGGADRLVGQDGADELHGGAGDDVLQGGADADRLDGAVGADVLHGDTGDDELHGGADRDQLFGGAGADSLYGDGGDDELQGGAGDDRLHGNAGADRLDGGEGRDWASYSGSSMGVMINLATGRGEGGEARGDVLAEIENLAGSGYDDVLRGDGGANMLHGLAGADELYGNGGDDILEGGAGADHLHGGAGLDQASYRDSDTGITIRLQSGYTNGGHAEGDVLIDIEIIRGSAHADILEGDDSANRLAGGGGDDELIGNGGADHLDGGYDDDMIDYSASDAGVRVNLEQGIGAGGHAEGDTINNVEGIFGSVQSDELTGDSGANYLNGWEGDDEIHGGAGNDELHGAAGDDELYGGAGDDRLEGGPGADRIEGGPGYDSVDYLNADTGVTVNLSEAAGEGGEALGDVISGVEGIAGSRFVDVLVGDDNGNTLAGFAGDDKLVGKDGPDTLYGGDGNDSLHGDASNDLLLGDSGDDELFGGEGNDYLDGGNGADRLEGGAGDDELSGQPWSTAQDGNVDIFVFAGEHGDDIVYGFADNEDKIDISAFNLSGFADLSVSSHHPGADVSIIDLSAHGGGTIALVGFDIANVDATDFLF